MAIVRHLGLVRDSRAVDPGDLTRVAAAIQKQTVDDFAPAWSRPATVDPFLKLEDVPLGHWPIVVRDDIPYDAQGIHLDNQYGPYALVRWDEGWSLTASHEILEMLGDPYGSRTRVGTSPKAGQGQVRFLLEVCDPCEAEQFAYTKDGIAVSDFYLRSYFDASPTAGKKYSFTGAITRPRQMLQGGYISWKTADGHWWQQTWFSGPQPKFSDLGAKPARVSARVFTDGAITVPKRFMTPKRARVAALTEANGNGRGTMARAIRANVREIAGVG
jgi:hypothetical protein